MFALNEAAKMKDTMKRGEAAKSGLGVSRFFVFPNFAVFSKGD